jgi:Taurine catabolism dioxygenase TauD, TfdA family
VGVSENRASASVGHAADELIADGFTRIDMSFPTSEAAFETAGAVVEVCRRERGLSVLSIVGEFVVPPIEGAATRDFQTLHFDFGLPLDPKVAQDVACYTALYVPSEASDVTAATRLVPLVALLGQRSWPEQAELVERLVAYGRTHGAWADEDGYTEGSLARIIEAAATSGTPVLPSVKDEPGFLCGLEFDSLSAELAFFSRHGLSIREVEIEIALEPGELLLFDNLAVAHGRRGRRQPGELRQRVFGQHLQPAGQSDLRDRVLAAFGT